MLSTINEYIQSLNSSKYFAGLMILTLNIGSRYIQINISDSMEEYIKYNIARELIILSIAWMGTRDIYIAITLTAAFVILADFLLNGKSSFCILSEKYTKLKVDTNNDGIISDLEINKAIEVLENAKKQKTNQRNMSLLNYYHDLKM